MAWSGFKLFTQQLTQSPLIGSFVLLAEFILFVWLWRVVSKNSWRFPSMKLTALSVVIITTVFAFAGVQPISGYKNTVMNQWHTYQAEQKAKAEERLAQEQLEEQKAIEEQNKIAEQNKIVEQKRIEEQNQIAIQEAEQLIKDAERRAFDLINNERVIAGLSTTTWDDSLYQLSKAHTQEMADRKELFHSDVNGPIGEDAWGGTGYNQYDSADKLAQAIVGSWMSSPLHKAWLLYAPLQHSVVSIVLDADGQYASWTFWNAEAGSGPPLIQKAYDLWQSETGGSIPWLTWLYDVKGYPYNQEFLKQLGIQ
jgi:uncharacterized protein YkwD